MKSITLSVPDELEEKEIAMIVASQLYQMGKLSSGQASRLVGISKREFLESLGRYGVSTFYDSPKELKKDIISLEKFLHDNR